MKRYPLTWVVPLVAFVLLCGLGIFGVIAAANSFVLHEKGTATQYARDAATGFEVRRCMHDSYSASAPLEMHAEYR